MSEERGSRSERALGRAVWGGLVGLGLLLAAVGVANEGFARILGLGLGVLLFASAFTNPARTFSARFVSRAGERNSRFWALWISLSSILIPLIAAFFPGMAVLSGVPLNLTFGAMIVGPAISAVLNLLILFSNLLQRSEARGS